MLRLEFTQRAVQDINRLREFIESKNPQAASRMGKQLHLTLSRLMEQPQLGRALNEIPGLREWVAGNYIARYTIFEERIVIIRVWHTKENR